MKKQKGIISEVKTSFDYAGLAKDLYQYRLDNYLSFGAIQATTGIPKPTLHKIEVGVYPVKIDILLIVCKDMGVNICKYFK